MNSTFHLAAGLLAIGSCGPLMAQAAAPDSAAGGTSAAAGVRAHIVVFEDDGARVEEVRVGGRVQRVTVQSKVGNMRAYEIQVAPAGRDPSQERGNAGKRTWSILSF